MKKNEIIPYNPKLKIPARELRNNSTKSEIILWNKIKKTSPRPPSKGEEAESVKRRADSKNRRRAPAPLGVGGVEGQVIK